jgi:hypothetical protein
MVVREQSGSRYVVFSKLSLGSQSSSCQIIFLKCFQDENLAVAKSFYGDAFKMTTWQLPNHFMEMLSRL